MVAVIKTGHSILRLLNYNENKVTEGVAELLTAVNYPIDASRMNFEQKLARLRNQAALNENVSRNSIHISLNFDPSEKLAGDKLQEIAAVYMDKIGMGDLPYLVYQHFDAGHPHIHIVSVKVRANGKRVDTQNIGKNQSELSRQEIEKDFGLVMAGDKSRQEATYRLAPVSAAKILYGRMATKRAIGSVLDTVLGRYRFASLPELNAVLKIYNVVADAGDKDSRVFQHEGLVYRVLDEAGNKVGVPIKASDFYNNPGLAFLRPKFEANVLKKEPLKKRVRNLVDMNLLGNKVDLVRLTGLLKNEGIDLVLRQNSDGMIYGFTYVDHKENVVFNGSDLGKGYSAKGLLERLNRGLAGQRKDEQRPGEKVDPAGGNSRLANQELADENKKQDSQETDQFPTGKLVDLLLDTAGVSEQMDWELKRKKRRKKRLRPD